MNNQGKLSHFKGRLKLKIATALITHVPRLHYAGIRFYLKGPYRGYMVKRIFDKIYALEKGKIDEKTLVTELMAETRTAVQKGEFSEWLERGDPSKRTKYLARCPDFAEGKSWRYQVYRLPPGEEHPPHGHHNLASFQLVTKGRLRVREYDRVERVAEDRLRLKLLSDRVLGPGEGFVTVENARNVHWFTALEDPVVSINFNLRGYAPETFYDEPPELAGRRYLIPEPATNPGSQVLAREVSRAEAKAFIAGRGKMSPAEK